MPYKNLPLVYLKKLKGYFATFRTLGEDNSVILSFNEVSSPEKWSFEYIDKEIGDGFTFRVNAFEYRESDQEVFAMVEYTPADDNQVKGIKNKARIKDVVILFDKWLKLVKEYNEVELTAQDSIRNYYQNLYTANFEILDSDSDNLPFDLERQLLIENFAVLCIDALKREKEQDEELIQDAIEIRDTVQNSTKKDIIIKISKFFAKVAQKSLPLLKEIATEAKKTIFKKAIEFGFKEIHELLASGYQLLN